MSDLPEGFELVEETPEGFEVVDDPVKKKPHYGRAVMDQIVQGGTFALGDEIQDAGAALYASMVTGQPYSDMYNMAREETEQRLDSQREAYPVTSGLSNIAGGVATGSAFAKAAPGVVSGIQKIPGGPMVRGAMVGVPATAAYTFGDESGSLSERGQAATEMAPYGAAFGAAGPLIGSAANRVTRPIGRLAQKALKYIRGNQPQVSQSAAKSISGRNLDDVPSLDELSQTGSQARLPTGAAKGDVNMMRVEEAARQGQLGPEYQAMMAQVDDQFKGDVLDSLQSVAGKTAKSSDELLEGGIESVQKRFKAEKRLASKLMKARNDKISKAGLYKEYTRDTLSKKIDDLAKNDPDFAVSLPKDSNAPIREDIKILNDLTGFGKRADGKISKPIDFSKLQAWRSGLNSYKQGTQESVLAGRLAEEYDGWLDNIARHAFKSGDDDTVEAIFKANKNYAAFKNKYGTNKYKGQSRFIEDAMQKDELTPDHLVNMAFGKTLSGNNYTNQNIKRMISAIPEGPKREALKQNFRSGLVMRAFENAKKGESVSLPILRNNLVKLRDNRAFKDNLADENVGKVLDGIIDDINKFVDANSRKDVYSPSGPALIRYTESLLDGFGFISSPVGGRGITEAAKSVLNLKDAKLGPDRKLVERSVAEFNRALKENAQDAAFFYGATGASAPGALLSSGGNQEYVTDPTTGEQIPVITVTPTE